MQKISYAIWVRNMQNWYDQKEVEEIQRLARRQPENWEEYEETAARVGEFVAKVNGCQCLTDIREQYHLVVGNARQAFNGDLKLIQDITHPSHRAYWKLNSLLAQKFARERCCHALKYGFVCYCDEHER